MIATVATTCSECRVDVELDLTAGIVTVAVPSNGRRGSLHVPAHTVTCDLWGDADLYQWDCPSCGHADSYDPAAAGE